MPTAESALQVITEQLQQGIAAPKCHKCGCLQQTVEALAETGPGGEELAGILAEAAAVFVKKEYDCLGCPICYPAIAANAFAEAFPEAGASLDLCPTEEPAPRMGWPALPGDYHVIRYGGVVAACTLNSASLAEDLANRKPEGLAVVGTLHTENLGIERIIKNIAANPNIRFLVLCGPDTQQAVGHLPGQSFVSLFENGIDARGRIIGAKGKRPVLKNVTRDEVHAFLRQVELVAIIGEQRQEVIAEAIHASVARTPGPSRGGAKTAPVEYVQASESQRLVLDPAGYFVIYPDDRASRLVVEHYTNQGVLNAVLAGSSTGALYGEVIARGLLTRLDHAAYLGRELARAEQSLRRGERFVQDAAPDNSPSAPGGGCGCAPTPRKKGCCS